jgi:hypothetical protein
MAKVVSAREKCDFVAVNEPNLKLIKKRNCYTSEDGGASIVCLNKSQKVMDYQILKSAVAVETEDVVLCCVYISPNKATPEDFEKQLDDIETNLKSHDKNKPVIITGDLNAKHPSWGGVNTNKRGLILLEWIHSQNLILLNDGKKPTCIRPNGQSYIDLTMINESAATRGFTWEVLDDTTLSDHQYTLSKLHSAKKERPKYYIKGITDFQKMSRFFREAITDRRMNAETCELAMKDAYKRSTPRIRANDENKMPFWWTLEIQNKITQTNRLRKMYQKSRRDDIRAIKVQKYKESKLDLKKKIASSKRKSWESLCSRLENDIFGDAYGIIKNQLRIPSPKCELPLDKKTAVFEELFITKKDRELKKEQGPETKIEWERVSNAELTRALNRIKSRKSPGPDGIPPEAVKDLVLQNADFFESLFGELIKRGSFPDIWKCAKLVLIEKPRKSPSDQQKYRPICLLNVIAKLFETIINDRLLNELEERNGINENQFGFRKGRSTVDAVDKVVTIAREAKAKKMFNALVLVDVKNTFNTASWPIIIDKLREKHVSLYLTNLIVDYLSDRRTNIERALDIETCGGVPQGSVLGPTLWNVLYDSVMNLEMPNGVSLICYADDLAVSVVAKTKTDLITNTETSLHSINTWMQENKLAIAPQKTVAIMLSGNRRAKDIAFELEESKILLSKEATYLGVQIRPRIKLWETY